MICFNNNLFNFYYAHLNNLKPKQNWNFSRNLHHGFTDRLHFYNLYSNRNNSWKVEYMYIISWNSLCLYVTINSPSCTLHSRLSPLPLLLVPTPSTPTLFIAKLFLKIESNGINCKLTFSRSLYYLLYNGVACGYWYSIVSLNGFQPKLEQ